MLITIALARTDGNREKAARLLNIGVRALQRKISRRRKNDS